MKELNDN